MLYLRQRAEQRFKIKGNAVAFIAILSTGYLIACHLQRCLRDIQKGVVPAGCGNIGHANLIITVFYRELKDAGQIGLFQNRLLRNRNPEFRPQDENSICPLGRTRKPHLLILAEKVRKHVVQSLHHESQGVGKPVRYRKLAIPRLHIRLGRLEIPCPLRKDVHRDVRIDVRGDNRHVRPPDSAIRHLGQFGRLYFDLRLAGNASSQDERGKCRKCREADADMCHLFFHVRRFLSTFLYVSRRADERQSSTSNRNLVNPVNLVYIFRH